MNCKDACEKIIEDLKNGNFDLSWHALERMSQRGLSAVDVIGLIESDALKNPIWNSEHESWNFTGYGFVSSLFTIACVYEDDGTLVVTVFLE